MIKALILLVLAILLVGCTLVVIHEDEDAIVQTEESSVVTEKQ